MSGIPLSTYKRDTFPFSWTFVLFSDAIRRMTQHFRMSFRRQNVEMVCDCQFYSFGYGAEREKKKVNRVIAPSQLHLRPINGHEAQKFPNRDVTRGLHFSVLFCHSTNGLVYIIRSFHCHPISSQTLA